MNDLEERAKPIVKKLQKLLNNKQFSNAYKIQQTLLTLGAEGLIEMDGESMKHYDGDDEEKLPN